MIETPELLSHPVYHDEEAARLLEAYPVDKPKRSAPDNLWFGAKELYDRAGFREVARRKPARLVEARTTRARLARRLR